MDGQALRDGKARVQQLLIDPLTARGMIRPRGMTVEAHDAVLASLRARLAYLTDDMVEALAEVVEAHAEGKNRNVWPSEISICNWARRLQPPPPSDSRLITSYLRSVAGRRALSEGYLVELFLYLKRHGQPPTGDYAMSRIREEAEENRRARIRIKARNERGEADPRETNWLRGYWDTRARCMTIMNATDETEEAAA
jgi:hypothetical protein